MHCVTNVNLKILNNNGNVVEIIPSLDVTRPILTEVTTTFFVVHKVSGVKY